MSADDVAESKVRAAQLGVELARAALQATQADAPPPSSADRGATSDLTAEQLTIHSVLALCQVRQCRRQQAEMFGRAAAVFGTQWALRRRRLLDSSAEQLCTMPARLIYHLCDAYLPKQTKIEAVSSAIDEIGRLYPEMDVSKVMRKLAAKWLLDEPAAAPDPRHDSANSAGERPTSPENTSLAALAPYWHINITKALFALRRQSLSTGVSWLLSVLNSSERGTAVSGGGESDGSQQTQCGGGATLRALCALVRLVPPDSMQELVGQPLSVVVSKLSDAIYVRQLELVGVSYTRRAFAGADKAAVVRSLLAAQRQSGVHSELAKHVAAALCLDYGCTTCWPT